MRIRPRRGIGRDATTSGGETEARSLRGARLGRRRAVARRRPRPLVGAAAARRRRARDRPVPEHALARASPRSSPGAADDFADVELDLEDGFYGDCARALRAVPRGEVVTYGELAALAGRPGAARAAGTFCARNRLSPFVPCHRVVAAGRDRLVRLARASTTSGACSRSKMSFSDDLRDELAAIAPTPALLPARRAVGALPRGRRVASARPRRARRPPRPREPGRGPARVHAAARARRRARRSAPIAGGRSTGRPATSCTSRSTRAPPRCSARRASSRRAARRSSARRSTSSAARAAAAPTCAARCSAAARSRARGHRTSSCGRAARTARSCSPRSPPARTSRCASLERRSACDRLREGRRDDRRPARGRRRKRDRAPPRRARRRRRDEIGSQPPGERRRGERQANGPGRPGAAGGDQAARRRQHCRAS